MKLLNILLLILVTCFAISNCDTKEKKVDTKEETIPITKPLLPKSKFFLNMSFAQACDFLKETQDIKYFKIGETKDDPMFKFFNDGHLRNIEARGNYVYYCKNDDFHILANKNKEVNFIKYSSFGLKHIFGISDLSCEELANLLSIPFDNFTEFKGGYIFRNNKDENIYINKNSFGMLLLEHFD